MNFRQRLEQLEAQAIHSSDGESAWAAERNAAKRAAMTPDFEDALRRELEAVVREGGNLTERTSDYFTPRAEGRP